MTRYLVSADADQAGAAGFATGAPWATSGQGAGRADAWRLEQEGAVTASALVMNRDNALAK